MVLLGKYLPRPTLRFSLSNWKPYNRRHLELQNDSDDTYLSYCLTNCDTISHFHLPQRRASSEGSYSILALEVEDPCQHGSDGGRTE